MSGPHSVGPIGAVPSEQPITTPSKEKEPIGKLGIHNISIQPLMDEEEPLSAVAQSLLLAPHEEPPIETFIEAPPPPPLMLKQAAQVNILASFIRGEMAKQRSSIKTHEFELKKKYNELESVVEKMQDPINEEDVDKKNEVINTILAEKQKLEEETNELMTTIADMKMALKNTIDQKMAEHTQRRDSITQSLILKQNKLNELKSKIIEAQEGPPSPDATAADHQFLHEIAAHEIEIQQFEKELQEIDRNLEKISRNYIYTTEEMEADIKHRMETTYAALGIQLGKVVASPQLSTTAKDKIQDSSATQQANETEQEPGLETTTAKQEKQPASTEIPPFSPKKAKDASLEAAQKKEKNIPEEKVVPAGSSAAERPSTGERVSPLTHAPTLQKTPRQPSAAQPSQQKESLPSSKKDEPDSEIVYSSTSELPNASEEEPSYSPVRPKEFTPQPQIANQEKSRQLRELNARTEQLRKELINAKAKLEKEPLANADSRKQVLELEKQYNALLETQFLLNQTMENEPVQVQGEEITPENKFLETPEPSYSTEEPLEQMESPLPLKPSAQQEKAKLTADTNLGASSSLRTGIEKMMPNPSASPLPATETAKEGTPPKMAPVEEASSGGGGGSSGGGSQDSSQQQKRERQDQEQEPQEQNEPEEK